MTGTPLPEGWTRDDLLNEAFNRGRGDRETIFGGPALAQVAREIKSRRVTAKTRPPEPPRVHPLKKRFDDLSAREMGAIIRVSSNYFRVRQETDADDEVAQLVWYGIQAFYEVAMFVGERYDPKLSTGLNVARMAPYISSLDAIVQEYLDRLQDRILFVINGELAQRLAQADADARAWREEMRAELLAEADERTREARDAEAMALAGAERATDEASAERRRAEGLETRLREERAAHAEELRRTTVRLEHQAEVALKSAQKDAERARTGEWTMRQRVLDLEAAAREGNAALARLQAENDRLRADLDAAQMQLLSRVAAPAPRPLDVVPAPLEVTVKLNPTAHHVTSALEGMSLAVFATARGVPATYVGAQRAVVTRENGVDLAPIVAAWRAATPDPLAHLRAHVRRAKAAA